MPPGGNTFTGTRNRTAGPSDAVDSQVTKFGLVAASAPPEAGPGRSPRTARGKGALSHRESNPPGPQRPSCRTTRLDPTRLSPPTTRCSLESSPHAAVASTNDTTTTEALQIPRTAPPPHESAPWRTLTGKRTDPRDRPKGSCPGSQGVATTPLFHNERYPGSPLAKFAAVATYSAARRRRVQPGCNRAPPWSLRTEEGTTRVRTLTGAVVVIVALAMLAACNPYRWPPAPKQPGSALLRRDG